MTPVPGAKRPSPDSSAAAIMERLRTRPRTVPELARILSLSGPGVRKQLAGLLQEGLAREAGVRPGRGRPATTYELTEAGEALFRGHRIQILESIFAALDAGAGEEENSGLMRDAGARLARRILERRKSSPDRIDGDRFQTAMELLKELGGREGFRQVGTDGEILGIACPLGEYSRSYPGACQFVAGFTEELLGLPVEPRCPRTGEPMCVLAVKTS